MADRAVVAIGLMLLLCGCSTRVAAPLLVSNTGDARYLSEIEEMDGVSYTGTIRPRVHRTARRLIQDEPAQASSRGMPHIDIARSCEEARRYSTRGDEDLNYRACVNDETAARQQIASMWPTAKSPDRQDCGALGRPPAPRYVEVLTCLQIASGGIMSPASVAAPVANNQVAGKNYLANLPPAADPATRSLVGNR